jgi:hypothetical protein
MRKRLLVVLAAAIALGGGKCNGNENRNEGRPPGADQRGKVVFCLFDLSASTEGQITREKYANSFGRILDKLSEGDTIVADAITDNPLSQSSFPVNETFPEFKPDTDNELLLKGKRDKLAAELRAARERINGTVVALLTDQSRKINRTRILDSLQLADRVFHTYNRQRQVLVVFSDMIEESDQYNFQKQRLSATERERIIEAQKKAGRLPDLSGVRVYVVGSSVGDQRSSDMYQNIQDFWLHYFKVSGADLAKERYGSALISFGE